MKYNFDKKEMIWFLWPFLLQGYSFCILGDILFLLLFLNIPKIKNRGSLIVYNNTTKVTSTENFSYFKYIYYNIKRNQTNTKWHIEKEKELCCLRYETLTQKVFLESDNKNDLGWEEILERNPHAFKAPNLLLRNEFRKKKYDRVERVEAFFFSYLFMAHK